MSITNDKGLFRIENDNFSYLIFLDGNGYLRHVYYGNKIEDVDVETIFNNGNDWSRVYLDFNDQKEHLFEDNYIAKTSLMEVATNAIFDKRGSTISIQQNDGSYYTNFLCKSYRIYDGTPSLTNIPYAKGKDGQSLEFTLVDELSGITMILTYSLFENSEMIIRTTKLINNTEEDINIERMMSLTLDIPDHDYDMIHFHGDWALERSIERTPLPHGTTKISSDYGKSSHVQNPFCIIAKHDCNDEYGTCFGFNLIWSGNFSLEAIVGRVYETRVNYGINDNNFEYVLKKGEEVELPQAVFSYSGKGLNHLSQNFHDFIREHIVPERAHGKYRSILFNSWEGCYMDFNTESIIEYMNCAKEIGAELFVLDDGWFGHRDNDASSLGDWYINQGKIDLKKAIDHCHSLGMKFGLWFEPEMISFDSDLYHKHPEYALSHQLSHMCTERHQFDLDMCNPNAIDDVVKQVNEILDNYPIDYVKWDNNREVGDNFSYYLGKDKQKAADYYFTLGVFKMYKDIVETHPNIFFEGCSAGGAKFDLGVLSYFPQIWCSDETDPVQRLFIQYGTGYGYPASTMGSHVSKNNMTSYETKSNIAFFGTYGYEFNPTLLNQEEKDQLKANEERYHRIHQEVILEGDMYRIYSPFEGNYFGELAVSKDKSKALFLFVNLFRQGNRYRFVKMKGLDPKKQYKNTYDNKVHSGLYYMNVGINFYRWFYEFDSVMIEFEEVK